MRWIKELKDLYWNLFLQYKEVHFVMLSRLLLNNFYPYWLFCELLQVTVGSFCGKLSFMKLTFMILLINKKLIVYLKHKITFLYNCLRSDTFPSKYNPYLQDRPRMRPLSNNFSGPEFILPVYWCTLTSSGRDADNITQVSQIEDYVSEYDPGQITGSKFTSGNLNKFLLGLWLGPYNSSGSNIIQFWHGKFGQTQWLGLKVIFNSEEWNLNHLY